MNKGYHVVYEKDMYEAISFAAISGFDFVQFDLGVPSFFLDGISDVGLNDIRKFAQDKNMGITFHGPCDNVSLFCDYPSIRSGILEQYKVILYKANILNARHITLHTGNHPEFRKVNSTEDSYIEQFGEHYEGVLQENLNDILFMSGNVLVCVENSGFNSFIMNTLEKMLCKDKHLSAKQICLTLDIPKLYSNTAILNKDIYRFMHRNKSHIREVHLHDLSKIYGRHQNIGEGQIDFNLFKDMIFQNDVYLNFEIRPKEAALVSMKKFSQMFKSEMQG